MREGFALAIWWLLGPLGILFGWVWLDAHATVQEAPEVATRLSSDQQFIALAPALLSNASTNLPWQHLSTATGDLPPPSNSTQQVLTFVFDVDEDGDNDFIIGARRNPGPALVWYRRDATGWTRQVIETDALQLEAGGAFHDIDGDGDLDVAAGTNNQNNDIWWWENPYPTYSGDWTRRVIKDSGANKHHDMMFGNFDDDPGAELVFWNQGAAQLSLVNVPADPRGTQPWPGVTTVWTAPSNQYEGLTQADVDGDGGSDIIGGGRWFKREGNGFTAHLIEAVPFARVAAAQLVPGGRPEIVQVPGDGDGPARWFQWDGAAWVGHTLDIGPVLHGHSLDVGDINGDAHLDLLIAEQRTISSDVPENADARLLALYGDSQGNFVAQQVATGYGNHESRLADLDNDGDLDILGKPFLWDTPRLDIWLNSAADDPPACEPLAQWTTHLIDDARPRRAVFVDTADLDGDNRPDVIAGAWWYRNPGAPGGAWTRQAIGAPLNQMAVVADLDGDGDADILGTELEGAQDHLGNDFVWARNNGAGGFTIHTNVPAGSGNFLQGAVVGSFSGAGPQVALSWHNMAGGTEALSVPANPTGAPWPLASLAATAAGEEISAGDIDRDGDLDLLLGAQWLENNAPDWTAHTLFDAAHEADRNRLVDMDGDGDLDAVIGFEGISVIRPVAWYEQPADPTALWVEHAIGTAVGPQSLDVGDLDGDGDVDVVIGEHNLAQPAAGRVLVFENRNGGWREHLVATGHEHHDGTQLVDIDGDGDDDIVSIGWAHGNVLLYERRACAGQPDATPTPTAAATATPTATATATATTAPGHAYLLSSSSGGNVSGIAFADEDVLRFDINSGQWSLYLDGSDVGLVGSDIDALHGLNDGTLLLSVDTAITLSGLAVDDSDVVRFVPASLGANTAGSFSLYFDGSDVGLTTNVEDVDGLSMTAAGLLLSTNGNATVSGASGRDEDLLLFAPASLGETTAGTWSLYFDGSLMGLGQSGEHVAAASAGPGGPLYLVGSARTQIGDLVAGTADIFSCALAGTGAATACQPAPSFVWRGAQYSYGNEAIDALALAGDGAPQPTSTATPTATATPGPTATPSATPPACAGTSAIGQWQWQRHVIDAARPGRATFLFTFDVNGDGRDDVLTGKFWYANPGAPGGVWPRTQLPAPIEDVIAAHDFDGDGDRDLLASTGATEPMDESAWWPFVWARNEGGGVFTVFDKLDVAGITMPPNDPIQGVAIARMTPGGPLQVVVTWDDTEKPNRNPHGVQMFTVPANPATQTWARQKISDVSTGEQLTAVDLDGDADLDVFMGHIWLRNNHPAATWTPITIFEVGDTQASRHELVDIDGDADLDAFIGYSHDPQGRKVAWHEQGNSPQATWPHHLITNLTRGHAESLDAGDLDGDGDPDVIIGEYNMVSAQERPASLWIFENLGQGNSWAQHLVYDGDSHYQSSQAYDIDGDGDVDILSKGWHHGRVHLYENVTCAP